MEIKQGREKAGYGYGTDIDISGDEVASAINSWLVTNGVYICGPRTIRINGELCKTGHIYIDPSGYVTITIHH